MLVPRIYTFHLLAQSSGKQAHHVPYRCSHVPAFDAELDGSTLMCPSQEFRTFEWSLLVKPGHVVLHGQIARYSEDNAVQNSDLSQS
ncbi:hypothetical protein WAI453_010843 [Rhynchosporium graminicola]